MKQKWIAVAAFFSFFMTFSSLVSAQAEQFVETIVVADIWYRPGAFTLAISPSSGENQSEFCVTNRTLRGFFKCRLKANESPQSVDDLNILFADRSQVTWTPSALQFAQNLYAGMRYSEALPIAVAAGINACGSVTPCINQALQFYGLQSYSPTLIPLLGQGIDLINWIRVNASPALNNPAKTMAQKYTNIEACFILTAENLANACN